MITPRGRPDLSTGNQDPHERESRRFSTERYDYSKKEEESKDREKNKKR